MAAAVWRTAHQEQYARFCKLIDEHRELPKGFADDMIMNSPSPNIMNKMARSVLSMYSYDEHADDLSCRKHPSRTRGIT